MTNTAEEAAFWVALGQRIESRRRELGLSRAALGQAIGISPGSAKETVRAIVAGDRSVNARELRILANLLELPLLELYP